MAARAPRGDAPGARPPLGRGGAPRARRPRPGNGGGHAGKAVGDAFLELQAAVAALDEREIVLRDLERGLVDFPALRDGREVYLCWVDGEADIGFWHELDAGYRGRQAL